MTNSAEEELPLSVLNHFALRKKADVRDIVSAEAIARVSKIKAWDIKELLERVLPLQHIISTRIRGPVSERSVCIPVDVEMSCTEAVERQAVTFTGVPGSFSLRPSLPPLDPSHDAALLKGTCNKSQQVLVLHNLPVKWFSEDQQNNQEEGQHAPESTPAEPETISPSPGIVKKFFEGNFGAIREIEIEHEIFNPTRYTNFDVAVRFQQTSSLHQALTTLCGRVLINTLTPLPSCSGTRSSSEYCRARYNLAVLDDEYFDTRNVRKRKFDREVRQTEMKLKMEEERKNKEQTAKEEAWAKQRLEADILRKRISVMAKKIEVEQTKKTEDVDKKCVAAKNENPSSKAKESTTRSSSKEQSPSLNSQVEEKETNQRFDSDQEDEEQHFRRNKVPADQAREQTKHRGDGGYSDRPSRSSGSDRRSGEHSHHHHNHHHRDHHRDEDHIKRHRERSSSDRRGRRDRGDDDDNRANDGDDHHSSRRSGREHRSSRHKDDHSNHKDDHKHHREDHYSSKRRKSDDTKQTKTENKPSNEHKEILSKKEDKPTNSKDNDKNKLNEARNDQNIEKELKPDNSALKQLQNDKSNTLKLLMLAKSAQQKKSAPTPASSPPAQQPDPTKMELALREKLLRNIVHEKLNNHT